MAPADTNQTGTRSGAQRATGRPSTEDSRTARRRIRQWTRHATADRFPYQETVSAFWRVGKQFVDDDLLQTLDAVRRTLPPNGGTPVSRLRAFLDVALDKWNGRYDYVSYTALPLLTLPSDADRKPVADRLLSALLADVLRFELAAQDGALEYLPMMRPGPSTVDKRCRHALHLLRTTLPRIGVAQPGGSAPSVGPVETARLVADVVSTTLSGDERHTLAITVLPVYTIHDEYLFIRVLQSFEVLFARQKVQLTSAIDALRADDVAAVVRWLSTCAHTFNESAPLFSLLATMQREAFRTFRQYTEGASAIQSPNYKQVESLCRRPDDARLASAAYRWVPQVRSRIEGGQPTLDDEFVAAQRAGRLTGPAAERISQAARAFQAAYRRWQLTHYRLAVRMLGTAPGTGYTAGTPYLREALDIPIFDHLSADGRSDVGGQS